MDNFFKQYFVSDNITKYENNLINNINQTIFGLRFSEYAFLLEKDSIVVVNNVDEAVKLQSQLDSIHVKSFLIKSTNLSPLYSEVSRNEQEIDLMKGINLLISKKIDILIVLPEVLVQKFPSKDIYLKSSLNLEIGKKLDIQNFVSALVNNGYKRQEIIQNAGEFSIRGDVIQFFPLENENAIRIELFDDEIESISNFNIDSLKIVDKIKEYRILPCSLACNCTDNYKENIIDHLKKYKFTNLDVEIKINEIFGKCLAKAISNIPLNFITPFLYDFDQNLFRFFEDKIIYFSEPKAIIDKINLTLKNLASDITNCIENGTLIKAHYNSFLSYEKIFEFKNNTLVAFSNILSDNRIFKTQDVITFKTSSVLNYNNLQNLLLSDLKNNVISNITTILFCKNENNFMFLYNLLKQNNIDFILKEDIVEKTDKKIILMKDNLDVSVSFVEEKICFISEFDLFKITKTLSNLSKSNKNITFLPKVGEYVVHETHGIGKCIGIEKLKLSNSFKDYILIEYSGGDVFYLPCEQISSLTSFMGSGENAPKLNKLGGVEFYKAKQKVVASLENMADDLIKIYGARLIAKGYKYPEDDFLQNEFERAFKFEPTQDQIDAVSDIKKDMETGKVMDRLICGDVGYGKTEVALRAAYKTILAGKQVAFLSPTTILSFQHYNTCLNRMKDFMVNIDLVNRFKSTKDINNTLKKLKNGEIDLLCGTHRLLSSDVEFKDLGLLILDEEQRFGVKDKEKIKKLKQNVNVLTLSATPIPRTLHMSLVGIRDISIIETPPKDRLPVQTSVCEFSFDTLKYACNREISRNGQVLIVYNRVETIYKFMDAVKSLMPEYRISCIHGQMPQNILETEMIKLYNKELDIMIATTLIENGIDLPSANTIFIVDADLLGLSQLYQLKGRVGRSTRLGYAFFTYNKEKFLSEQAYKRLEAISAYTELGSGLKIAMRDLEIRGTGNVLGKEQHGHMEKVGYDLYCKLLKSAINKAKGEKEIVMNDVKLDIQINAFIPENYIQDSETRIKCYTKLSNISSETDRQKTLKEISDVFGEIPVEISNLSYVSYIKYLSEKNKVKRVFINKDSMLIQLYKDEDIVNLPIFIKANKNKEICSIDLSNGVRIIFNIKFEDVLRNMQFLIDFLN